MFSAEHNKASSKYRTSKQTKQKDNDLQQEQLLIKNKNI
jgi:hypothetical protein